jgi:arylsulfatase A-like enzyme
LIIHWPASAGNYAERVSEPAGLIDVAPTLLAFLHIAGPASFAGVDLLGGSGHVRRQVYSETMYAHDAFHWAALRRLRVSKLAYVDAPRPELYDLTADPAERNNIAPAHA